MKKYAVIAMLMLIGTNIFGREITLKGGLKSLATQKRKMLTFTYDSDDFRTFGDLKRQFVNDMQREYDITYENTHFWGTTAGMLTDNLEINMYQPTLKKLDIIFMSLK